MNKFKSILCFSTVTFLLIGCSNNKYQETEPSSLTSNSALDIGKYTKEYITKINDSETPIIEDSSNRTTQNEKDNQENANILSNFSNEEIEYARIWLLLGSNQEISELNVIKIPSGTPINPNDNTSTAYPEDVIQLAGSRLVDGSVTYSGNGNGTINVYNVPLRWESNTPGDLNENYMQEYTQSIIENTEVVDVDLGNVEEITKLIEIMNIH